MVSALLNPLHEIKFWKYADSDPSYSKLPVKTALTAYLVVGIVWKLASIRPHLNSTVLHHLAHLLNVKVLTEAKWEHSPSCH